MASVSPPPQDAMEFSHVLMEVMRETAVSLLSILTFTTQLAAMSQHYTCYIFLQFSAKLEFSYAAIVSVSVSQIAVMGL